MPNDGYHSLATFYDLLTGEISYPERACYFAGLIREKLPKAELLLDLACGTGSLSVELARLGFDVIAVDCSCEMLSGVMEKRIETGLDILPLCQSMTELNLFGTVDAAVCALDSLNHITDEAEVKKALAKVALFMNPGGVFVFDVNTLYKHEKVLGNNTFVYDMDEVFCVWQNEYRPENGVVEMHLDLFSCEEETNSYYRSEEQITERAYSENFWRLALAECGFSQVECFAADTREQPGTDCQRIVFRAIKM